MTGDNAAGQHGQSGCSVTDGLMIRNGDDMLAGSSGPTWLSREGQYDRPSDVRPRGIDPLSYMLSAQCDDEIVAEPEMQSALAW